MESNTGVEDLSLYFTAASEYRVAHGPDPSGILPLKFDPKKRTIPEFPMGSKSVFVTVHLINNGDNKLVTDKNKGKYLELMVKHCTSARFGLQAKAVRTGGGFSFFCFFIFDNSFRTDCKLPSTSAIFT